jgi:DNA-directed RNA polymerase specialized sigma24 family protein
MAHQIDLQLLTLGGLAHRCAQETELFFRRQGYDPRYCFELFRRAIIGRDQHAWQIVYTQYQPLVVGWVERHSAFPDSGEEVQYFVNRAFEKMWHALPPDKFGNFPNLKSLLRYLQVCVHSVILDQVRKVELAVVDIDDEATIGEHEVTKQSTKDRALDKVHRQELWQEIDARLNTDQERKVMFGSFVLALKPQDLLSHYPEAFDNVSQIYRAKENVLARLRRDAELLRFLGGDA